MNKLRMLNIYRAVIKYWDVMIDSRLQEFSKWEEWAVSQKREQPAVSPLTSHSKQRLDGEEKLARL